MGRRERSLPERRRAWIAAALLGAASVTVVLVAFAPLRCDLSHRGEARTVRMAVQHWQASGMAPACPTFAQLIRHGFLDPGVSRSAALEFQIACSPSEVTVVWAGPDRQFGTLDDETAPESSDVPKPLSVSRLGVALPVALLASLTSSALAILATLFRTSRAHALRRVAAIAGWLVIGVSAGAGLVDMTISRIAATRPGLSRADAERSRARGTRVFLAQAVVGAAAGLPGVIIVPLRRRRRESVRARMA